MEFNEFRIKAKQIEDDFIQSGLNYKAVVDKITIDLFDEIEEWIESKLHQPTVISAVCDVCGSDDITEAPHMGRNCNSCNPL